MTLALYFKNIGNMEIKDAGLAFAALAHNSRLAIIRLLVPAGPEGMPAGTLGTQLALPPATLSFHLKELRHAGLVNQRRAGRTLYYAADFDTINALIAYLTENCCQGAACMPAIEAQQVQPPAVRTQPLRKSVPRT